MPQYRAIRAALLGALLWASSAAAQPAAPPADGPTIADTLDLAACLDATVSRNRELIAARERVEEVEGDKVVVRSRLLPQLQLSAAYNAQRTERAGRTDDYLSSELLFQQRLFEFGPDAATEVAMRSDLRQAISDYQSKAYQVTSRVWELYHLILLQDQQISLRQASKKAFDAALARQEARFEKRLAREEDKLSAEINVLEEELAINGLRREQFRNKMELLRLIGRPIGIDLALRDSPSDFTLDEALAVRIALGRDVQIELNRQLVDEQRRTVREIGWEYAPDLAVDAGVEDGRRRAGVSVDKDGKTWGVGVESGLALSEQDLPTDGDGATWTARVEARIPLFEGGARIGRENVARARLRRLQVELRDLNADVELRVRQAYQNMLEAQENQHLQEQRVAIARRRLEIQQLLVDSGQGNETQLETVRTNFFNAQDRLFGYQRQYISLQAQLRRQMGYVE